MSKYTNADLFMKTFNGMYATELWSLPEKDFLEWLNAPAADVAEVVRCKDCIYHTGDDECTNGRWDNWSNSEYGLYPEALEMDYCSYGERKDG